MAYSDKVRQKEYADQYYQNHCEAIKASNKEWKANNPVKVFRGRCQRRASDQKIDFNLSAEWFEERLVAGTCEVSGLPFVASSKKMAPFKPSVDRTDPKRGYTEDNCKMVVWCYNSGKGDNHHDDVMILARALVNKYDNNNHNDRPWSSSSSLLHKHWQEVAECVGADFGSWNHGQN